MTYYVDEIDGVFFTDRTDATEQEFRDRIAAFDGADEAEESLRERLIDALDAELDSLGLSQGISSRAAYHLAQTALDVVTTPVYAAVAVAAYRAQDGGACGDLSPSINFGGDGDVERLMCELPVGHGGAHQHDNRDGLPLTRWIATQDGGAEEAVRRARWIDSPMQEPWHRDLVAGTTSEHSADLRGWAERIAHTYSKSGTLEITAVIWALLDCLDAALAPQAGDGAR